MKFIFLILFFVHFCSFSQELSLYHQSLFNPTVAGKENSTIVRFTFRQQWAGINGSPKIFLAGAITRFGENTGFGGFLLGDKSGNISLTGIQFIYAYHIKLGKNDDKGFAFGISARATQHNLDQSKFKLSENNDPIINGNESKLSYYGNFGASFYWNALFVATTLTASTPTEIILSPKNKTEELSYNAFLHLSLMQNIGKLGKCDFYIEPYTLLRYSVASKNIQFSQYLKFHSFCFFSFGGGYKFPNTLMGIIAFKVGKLNLSYLYDYTPSEIFKNSFGTHEIMIGFVFPKKNRKSAVPCPAYRY